MQSSSTPSSSASVAASSSARLQARSMPSPAWLSTAVFYEIYPQSFFDTNADGIGDLQGIIAKLDYIRKLGANALWLNPCFDSPFKDAGYDVRDYYKVAPRYGSNEDLVALFRAAHHLGMHVLLDLVPGHTSEEHAWFQASRQAARGEFSDRYIWTNSAFQGSSMPFIGGESERDGTYILNFFKCQPALNYGFAKRDADWQDAPDSPAAQSTCQAMVDIMRFWLALGCDGFRVDMANSLVKQDGDDKPQTIHLWQGMLGTVKAQFPEAAFVSEWGVPEQALEAGFDMDFYLDWRWDGKGNGYNLLLRNTNHALDRAHDGSYFNADSGQSIQPFLEQYLPQYEATREQGYFCFITCNHDTPRIAPRLSDCERKIAFGMLMTMPGVPFVYYGDEIGLPYRDLPTKEGGYHRTGSRTPMQWDARQVNDGFSFAAPEELYLPVGATQHVVDAAGVAGTAGAADIAEGKASVSDAGVDTTTANTVAMNNTVVSVAGQEACENSMLHWMRGLLAARAERSALQADGRFAVLAAPSEGRSFVYARYDEAGCVMVAMNPGRSEEMVEIAFDDMLNRVLDGVLNGVLTDEAKARLQWQPLMSVGNITVTAASGDALSEKSDAPSLAAQLTLAPQSFALFVLR